jgi:hypothetical protein
MLGQIAKWRKMRSAAKRGWRRKMPYALPSPQERSIEREATSPRRSAKRRQY